MRPAISTVTYMHHGWEQALDCAAEAGYQDLELLMIPGWIHLQPGTISAARLAGELARRSLALIGVHGGGLDGNDERVAARDRDNLAALIPYAAEAGAAFLNINGKPVPTGTAPEARDAMLDRIVGTLRDLEPIARAHGIAVTLENHRHCLIETGSDYRRILDAFPAAAWLGATVDTGHCAAAGVDAASLVASVGRRLLHVHLKDHAHGRSVGLGEGTIDNARILRAAQALGYRGHLSVELELGDADTEREAAKRALPYLRLLIAQAQAAGQGGSQPLTAIRRGAAS